MPVTLWASVEQLADKSCLLMVSSDIIPSCRAISCLFLLCKLKVAVNQETVIGRII